MPSVVDHPPDLVDGRLHGPAHGVAATRAPTGVEAVLADAANSAEHHPPFRPEAPKPTTSRSRTAMRRVGSASAR